MVVSHSNSTSNHNIIGVAAVRPKVVSHSNSTSNHNISLEEARLELLFLIPILHQTTTYERSGKRCALLFLIPILHQTTTAMQTSTSSRCCFSFQFYIKPQPGPHAPFYLQVVSHSNSTSNHNAVFRTMEALNVVSHSNSTSNHNVFQGVRHLPSLFLIPILHQTTTLSDEYLQHVRCFSFQFYIKPQQNTTPPRAKIRCFSFQFYIKPQLDSS